MIMTNQSTELATDDPTRIELDHFYPHPPAKVWRALTEPEFMGRWLMAPDTFEARAGHRFTFQARPMPAVGFSGQVACVILDATPPKRLSYSWDDAERSEPTGWVITWELIEEGHGTRLILRHTGFDPDLDQQQRSRTIMSGGWVRVLDGLEPVLG